MIKETCNARDVARMRKLAAQGATLADMGAMLNISIPALRRNLIGVRVARDPMVEIVDSDVIGSEVPGAPAGPAMLAPFTAGNPGPVAIPAPTHVAPGAAAPTADPAVATPAGVPAHPNPNHTGHPAADPELTPAQKGAATRAANAAEKSRLAEDLSGPETESDFLE